MMNSKRMLLWALAIVTGGFMSSSPASAADLNYTSQLKAGETKYQKPEDLIDRVPFLSEIPRTFLFGDGFKMKLSAQELRIDHMGTRSHNPANKRLCMIGFSYTTPVAGFFTSRIDLPLFHSETLALTDWSLSSLGDYVVYLSRTAVDQPLISLVASARF